jgi:hypothetical protein
MLEIKKCAVSLEEDEVMELERIITDSDEKVAFRFVKRSIYDKILHSQQGKLKSHLDSANPVERFISNK